MASDPATYEHPALQPWVAFPDDLTTSLVAPVFIEQGAAADIGRYHPQNVPNDPYFVRHIAAGTMNAPFVKVTDIRENWSQELRQVMEQLALYPVRIKGVDMLIDSTIGQRTVALNGWKVTRWVVLKSFQVADRRELPDDELLLVHQDVISWAKELPGAAAPRIAMSALSWRAYARLQE